MPELSHIQQISVNFLSRQAAQLQQQTLAFNTSVAKVIKELETAYPGYTLDIATGTLVTKPAPPAPAKVVHEETQVHMMGKPEQE
jgi:hypothetical protein